MEKYCPAYSRQIGKTKKQKTISAGYGTRSGHCFFISCKGSSQDPVQSTDWIRLLLLLRLLLRLLRVNGVEENLKENMMTGGYDQQTEGVRQGIRCVLHSSNHYKPKSTFTCPSTCGERTLKHVDVHKNGCRQTRQSNNPTITQATSSCQVVHKRLLTIAAKKKQTTILLSSLTRRQPTKQLIVACEHLWNVSR